MINIRSGVFFFVVFFFLDPISVDYDVSGKHVLSYDNLYLSCDGGNSGIYVCRGLN